MTFSAMRSLENHHTHRVKYLGGRCPHYIWIYFLTHLEFQVQKLSDNKSILKHHFLSSFQLTRSLGIVLWTNLRLIVCGGGSERQETVWDEREPQAIYHVPGLRDFIVACPHLDSPRVCSWTRGIRCHPRPPVNHTANNYMVHGP